MTGTVSTHSGSREDESGRISIDPAANHICILIAEALDVNEHVRAVLVKCRESPGMREAGRRRIDIALGRLSKGAGQYDLALIDVEKAGGQV